MNKPPKIQQIFLHDFTYYIPFNIFSASSFSSCVLFVASITQEDVYLGYPALALTLGL